MPKDIHSIMKCVKLRKTSLGVCKLFYSVLLTQGRILMKSMIILMVKITFKSGYKITKYG